VSWYLCTISASSKRNWSLCKESLTWGISTASGFASSDRAKLGDALLFWVATIGYVGMAQVLEDVRPPNSILEVPWLGGQKKYGLVIPIGNLREFSPPLKLGFNGRKQIGTELDQSTFQRGYMPISDKAAGFVNQLILTRGCMK
jgi:hypothetical protein